MKKMMFLGLAAAMLSATGAQAAVTVSQSALGSAPKAGTTITFDEKTPAGFSVVGGLIQSANNSFGSNPTGSSNYLTTNNTDGRGSASIFSKNAFSEISFDWGTIDDYNTFALLDQAGNAFYTLTGSQFLNGANGTAGSRITLASADAGIYGLRLFSSAPAFEVDNVTFSGAVPEPATWAMMILGFGLVGAAMRRRSSATAGSAVAA